MTPTTTETTFGTVTRREDGSTAITATGAQLVDWASRGDGNRWPCSVLAQLDSITATFDASGDLVDVVGAEDAETPADEFNAWASECLVRAGYPSHPAIRPAVKVDPVVAVVSALAGVPEVSEQDAAARP